MNRLHDLVLARQLIHYIDFDETAALIESQGFTTVRRSERRMLWYAHEMIVAVRGDRR